MIKDERVIEDDERRSVRGIDDSRKQSEYIVLLPFEMNYSGAGKIPRLSLTRASTPNEAVTHVIERIVPKDQIGRFVNQYKRVIGDAGYRNGLASFAYEVPDVTSYDIKNGVEDFDNPLSMDERKEAMEIFLREEVSKARGRGNPRGYGEIAEKLVDWYFNQKARDRLRLNGIESER